LISQHPANFDFSPKRKEWERVADGSTDVTLRCDTKPYTASCMSDFTIVTDEKHNGSGEKILEPGAPEFSPPHGDDSARSLPAIPDEYDLREYIIISRSPFRELLISYGFQLLGLAAAITFGVWAVKSYDSSLLANDISSNALSSATIANRIAQQSFEQSMVQNQLALLQFCASNDDKRFNQTCTEYLSAMADALPTIATALASGSAATSTGIPFPVLASRPGLSFGALVGIIAAAVAVLGAITLSLIIGYPRRGQLAQVRRHSEK
jgi:hypothetical protein